MPSLKRSLGLGLFGGSGGLNRTLPMGGLQRGMLAVGTGGQALAGAFNGGAAAPPSEPGVFVRQGFGAGAGSLFGPPVASVAPGGASEAADPAAAPSAIATIGGQVFSDMAERAAARRARLRELAAGGAGIQRHQPVILGGGASVPSPINFKGLLGG